MCRLILPLIVLVPQDSTAVDCVACCKYAIVRFDSGRTIVLILHMALVAGISKILCTSEVASATRNRSVEW